MSFDPNQFDQNGNYIGAINGSFDWLRNFQPQAQVGQGQMDPSMNSMFGQDQAQAQGVPGQLNGGGIDPVVPRPQDTPGLPPPDGPAPSPLLNDGNVAPVTPRPQGVVDPTGVQPPNGLPVTPGTSPNDMLPPPGLPLGDPSSRLGLTGQIDPSTLPPGAVRTPPQTQAAAAPPPPTTGLYPGDNKNNSKYQFVDGTDYSKVGAINWYDFQGNAYAQSNAERLPLELDPNTSLKAGLNPQTLDMLEKQYGYQVGKLGYTDYNAAIRDLYSVGGQNPGTDFYLVPQTDGNWGILARARTAAGQQAYGFTPPSMRPAQPAGGGGGGGGRNVSRGTSGGSGSGVREVPVPTADQYGQPYHDHPLSANDLAAQAALKQKAKAIPDTPSNYVVPVDPNNPLNNPKVGQGTIGMGAVNPLQPHDAVHQREYQPIVGAIQSYNGKNYQWNGSQWVLMDISQPGANVVAG